MSKLTLDTAAVAHRQRSVSMIMMHVIAALIPGVILYALLIDSRIISNIFLAALCALVFEAVLLMLRGRAPLPVIKDASVVLAAILLVLSVPQSLPIWQLISGVFILCTLGKHVFGGLGHNPFNPAMVAYAFLLVSFPLTMTQWNADNGLLDAPSSSMSDRWDSVSRATPLDRIEHLSAESTQPLASHTTEQPQPGTVTPGQRVLESDWVWVSVAWLAGGLYLLLVKVIGWRIPVSILLTLWCLYFLYAFFSAIPVLPATVALLSGAIMLGAFFIATDPVSAASSNPGKLLYGIGIGLLCFIIREFSAYPEGIAFAVLLMNMCVPLIDHAFTRKRFAASHVSDEKHDKLQP